MSNKMKITVFKKLLKKAAEGDLFTTMDEMGCEDLKVYKIRKNCVIKAMFLVVAGGAFLSFFCSMVFIDGHCIRGVV